jgi:hypothetical protein
MRVQQDNQEAITESSWNCWHKEAEEINLLTLQCTYVVRSVACSGCEAWPTVIRYFLPFDCLSPFLLLLLFYLVVLQYFQLISFFLIWFMLTCSLMPRQGLSNRGQRVCKDLCTLLAVLVPTPSCHRFPPAHLRTGCDRCASCTRCTYRTGVATLRTWWVRSTKWTCNRKVALWSDLSPRVRSQGGHVGLGVNKVALAPVSPSTFGVSTSVSFRCRSMFTHVSSGGCTKAEM